MCERICWTKLQRKAIWRPVSISNKTQAFVKKSLVCSILNSGSGGILLTNLSGVHICVFAYLYICVYLCILCICIFLRWREEEEKHWQRLTAHTPVWSGQPARGKSALLDSKLERCALCTFVFLYLYILCILCLYLYIFTAHTPVWCAASQGQVCTL